MLHILCCRQIYSYYIIYMLLVYYKPPMSIKNNEFIINPVSFLPISTPRQTRRWQMSISAHCRFWNSVTRLPRASTYLTWIVQFFSNIYEFGQSLFKFNQNILTFQIVSLKNTIILEILVVNITIQTLAS